MRKRQFLVAILLGVVLCFMSGAGYGEIREWMDKAETSYMEGRFLTARIDYMMTNPTSFLSVIFGYDRTGTVHASSFPESVDTKGKICVRVFDNRDVFSDKSGIGLLDSFKKNLEVIYSFISVIATNMDTDIAAVLESRQGIPLAYFYQGKYHLWEE